jgi:hypothetical protein
MPGSRSMLTSSITRPGFSHARQVSEFIESQGAVWYVGYAAVFILFAARETQRRDKLPKIPQLKPIQIPLFVLGLILLALWGVLFRSEVFANLDNIWADSIPVLAGIVTIPVVAFILVRYYTRGGRNAIV